ncbi:MAG: DUF4835 family protein [Bacteroidota bacterium]
MRRPSSTHLRALVLGIGALCVGATSALAQSGEFNCNVSVNYESISGTEYNFLEDLRDDVFEYVNNRSWTDLFFEEIERIGCDIAITIRDAESLSRFRAEIFVRSLRPIYGNSVSTTVFAVADDTWTFDYNRGQPLIYDPNQYNSLTSVIDFYIFLMLGYDFDTFEELGGTPYFEQAREIADIATGRGVDDWVAIGDDRSRTTLIQQLLDPLYVPLRRAYFQYHFGALDRFATQHEQAWETAFEALTAVYGVFEEFNQLRYAIDLFITAKSDEIVNLFREADQQRNDLYDMLIDMNPSNLQVYQGLLEG